MKKCKLAQQNYQTYYYYYQTEQDSKQYSSDLFKSLFIYIVLKDGRHNSKLE